MQITPKLLEKQFTEVIELIKESRYNALRSVNTELIKLYWQIGKYITTKVESAEWGASVVAQLAYYIKKRHPDLKGYSDKNLWRMKQFYETYKEHPKLSTLLRELPWSSNLHILNKTKSIAEKEFYLRLAIKEKYSVRELERQINSCFFERTMLSKKVTPLVSQTHSGLTTVFKDMYMLDFLDLPQKFSEKDLRCAIVQNFKKFILEFGKDFAFVGEEYRVQVGNNDYYIDLLFYHRELRCLVAFELKIDDFKPEYLGKMNFYLESLDRDVKKSHENPSVGVILCKSKDKEVVKYALSRNMSPSLIAEYKIKLIPKRLLQNKLHELFEIEGKES